MLPWRLLVTKLIDNILKNVQKTSVSVLIRLIIMNNYMINYDENVT